MRLPRLLKFVISVCIPLFAGFLGSIATSSSVSDWYVTLQKPSFNPPSTVFSPVWTLLFILMGIAFFYIWDKGCSRKACGLFFTQLGLNILWSVMFFGLRSPRLALIEIVVLWIAILLTMIEFRKTSKKAFWLMVPYIAWVSFAFILNYAIFVLN